MPTISDDVSGLLKEVCKEWNEAEEVIKRAEQIVGDAVIPAIKELRYSGRRIIEATCVITEGGDEDRIKHLLRDALFNCHRAQHDAVDASVSTINVHIAAIKKKVSDAAILKVYPDYSELLAALDAVHGQIADARSKRDNRNDIYDSIRRVEYTRLEESYRKFRASEDVMRRATVRGRLKMLGGWIFGAATLIIAVAAIILK